MIKNRLSFSILVLACSLAALSSVSFAQSLWTEESSSLYSTQKTFNGGDIITILILESSSAIHQAGTDTDTKDDLAMRFDHTIQSLYDTIGPRNEVSIRNENKYKGQGKTSRSSNLQAKVSAIVTKVFPNGNLAIMGHHSVEINGEREDITITGLIRSKDVTMSNTVFSYQVADANIAVNGEGTVADAESPGWFTRILNWLF
jgi:flagellar L-ring protein precursor FlgH